MSTEPLLTTVQVAALLYLSPRQVTELASSGRLVGKKIGAGRAWWFHQADVDAYVRSRDGHPNRLRDREDRPLGAHAQEVFDHLTASFVLQLPPNPLAPHPRVVPKASTTDLARYRGHASEEIWASYERAREAIAAYTQKYLHAHAAISPLVESDPAEVSPEAVAAFVQSIIEIGSARARGGRVPSVEYLQDGSAEGEVRVWSWSFRGRADALKALHEPLLGSSSVRQVALAAREAERAIAELSRVAAPDRLRRLILDGACADCP